MHNSDNSEARIDINILKEIARKDLVDALNSVNGAKTLVLDASLAGPLGLVTEVSLLKHQGVEKMFWLESGPLTSSTTNIVYLCRPRIKHVKTIADKDHIKRHAKESRKYVYTLLLVPRVSTLVSRILEEEGVLGDVTISSYNLQFIPVADDVISLEHENTLRELWVDGDETILFDSAQALLSLQKLYGSFPQIIGKGDFAQRVATLITRQGAKSTTTSRNTILSTFPRIDSLIILDRRVDMITPLLTQLTYEGLVDEVIGVKNSHVELPLSLLQPPTPANANTAASASTSPPSGSAIPVVSVKKDNKKKHHLTTATDPLYAELRDMNFSSIGRKLNRVAHRLDADYKTDLQSKSVPQLRDFVGKLGGLQTEHQALRLHTGISEMIVPYTRTDVFNKSLEIQQNLLASYEVSAQLNAIEDLVAQGAEMQIVLRLLCLASLTAGGVKAKNLESLKREILQVYGYEYLSLLLSLSSPHLSILLPNPLPASHASLPASKYPFTTLRKSLRLLIDDNPEALDEVENDISFVYSGYAPISIRLVQCIAQKGGVISNPADKEKPATETGNADGDLKQSSAGKFQAHPIVGWKGFEDVVAAIPGQTVEITQKVENSVSPAATSLDVVAFSGQTSRDSATTTVVFFLGGCTYTEIAALRWVGRQNKGRNFLIATTGIINGSNIMEGIAGLTTSVKNPSAV
ncbi:ATP binding protein [Crepidotus variabilis]|uniref:ATP binding protein n=1 Tax=Crepidotus variabilis TaxID=179855 RepID=A0A9P6JT14_9AGAR|nr:ATP binding protein [Crepidotus variabilis]